MKLKVLIPIFPKITFILDDTHSLTIIQSTFYRLEAEGEGGEDFGGSLSCKGNVGEGSVVPNGIFRGWYIIANHKRAVVLSCLCYMQRRNIGQPLPLVAIFFVRVLCEGQRVFAGN